MSFWKLLTARWGSGDGETDQVRIDKVTNSLQTVDYPHHEIHAGDHYFMEGYVELDDTDTLHVKLVTPNTTKWSHFKWEITSTGVLTTTLDEDATGGMTGGTSVIPINNNRNSANTSGMTITSGVTACTGYTTRVSNQKFGVATTPSKATGGGSGREDELMLKQNTVYCRSFTSGSNGNIVNFKASWYEHTDKH